MIRLYNSSRLISRYSAINFADFIEGFAFPLNILEICPKSNPVAFDIAVLLIFSFMIFMIREYHILDCKSRKGNKKVSSLISYSGEGDVQ